MQAQGLFMQSANRNRIIIATLIGLVVVIIIGIGFFAQNNSQQNGSGNNNDTTIDKNSGDTVVDPSGRTPEKFGNSSDVPLFLGIAKFIDYGLSDVQVQDLKYAFYQYAKSANPKVTQVSITADSLTSVPRDRNDPSPRFALTFDFIANEGTTKTHAKVEYFNTDSIQLYIFDATGKVNFDSSTVTNQSIQ
jgi:hypothetical protein